MVPWEEEAYSNSDPASNQFTTWDKFFGLCFLCLLIVWYIAFVRSFLGSLSL